MPWMSKLPPSCSLVGASGVDGDPASHTALQGKCVNVKESEEHLNKRFWRS